MSKISIHNVINIVVKNIEDGSDFFARSIKIDTLMHGTLEIRLYSGNECSLEVKK